MFLLDTNVVSELRRKKPHGAVLKWLNGVPDEHLFIAGITIGEIQAGRELTREQDRKKALEIEAWLDSMKDSIEVLPMGATEFRAWARLKHQKSDTLIEDLMIAATAAVNNLTIVTRNVRDFKGLGVDLINPFTV